MWVVERECVGPCGVGVRRKKLVRGILVFSISPLAKMSHFYCSVAKMRPFNLLFEGQINTLEIVWWPN